MGNYIRFDWAMKRLLRDASCWAILEGLLTVVLNKPVRILHVLQSCANLDDDISESSRIDLLVDGSEDGPAWVEIQNNNEYAYYQRALFGLSRELTNCINSRGEGYEHVRKIYSVNIVYFSLGHGKDFVYHGKTEFRGIHEGDLLERTWKMHAG